MDTDVLMDPEVLDAPEPTEELDEAVGEGLDVGQKCAHGNYIAKGDSTARYCSGCTVGQGIIIPLRRAIEVSRPERDIDTAEFMESSVWDRLQMAERMEAMC